MIRFSIVSSEANSSERIRRGQLRQAVPVDRSKPYNAEWKRFRLWYLRRHPRCVVCGKAANEIDHIEPMTKGGSKFDLDNLQAMCKRCHSRKTRSELEDGVTYPWRPKGLSPSAVPLTIVCGAPGSGKTTYVMEHKAQNDTVIDLDLIASELSGAPIYHYDKAWLSPALRERNRRLRLLSKQEAGEAWFVVTAPSPGERQWWVEQLRPRAVLIMWTPALECVRRIANDTRRTRSVDDYRLSIGGWFRRYGSRPGDRLVTGLDR